MHLPFDMTTVAWLADHRVGWLTALMRGTSFLGDINGYIFVTTFIYVTLDKALAVRLSLIVTGTMCLNHALKLAIGNPRPFVREGDFITKWAVPRPGIELLRGDFSTPSGHAMGSASFYSYLFGAVRRRDVRIVAVVAILLIGASRPYLGVHYVADVLLGWALGLAAGLLALRDGERLAKWWSRRPYSRQIGLVLAASLVYIFATWAANGWRFDDQPRTAVAYAGAITGILAGRPLELVYVGFDPKSASWLFKAFRFVLTVALTILCLEALGLVAAVLADRHSVGGYALQYLRYALVGVVNLFVAPWVFTRLGWAERAHIPPRQAAQSGLRSVAVASRPKA